MIEEGKNAAPGCGPGREWWLIARYGEGRLEVLTLSVLRTLLRRDNHRPRPALPRMVEVRTVGVVSVSRERFVRRIVAAEVRRKRSGIGLQKDQKVERRKPTS